MPKRYKLWIEIEEISDDPDDEESTIDFTQCVREFGDIAEARSCRDKVLAVNCPRGSIEQKEARQRLKEVWDRMYTEEEAASDGKQ